MNDLLPADSGLWQQVESVVRRMMSTYDYREIRTPIMESTSLFKRGIGEATDIVEKEMYSFDSRGDKSSSMTLRPENTAGCVRAAIQHGLMTDGVANRIWYYGPMFRYERPQKGRTRQFHQVGAEVYGVAGAQVEAELILLSARLWSELGIADALQLELNSLGSRDERQAYRQSLVSYFRDNAGQLDEDSVRRLESNPLRILDSKNPDMQQLNDAAPQLLDALGAESRDHFELIQQILTACGIAITINPRLVRGLDYYSHTVWEWTTELLGAQATVCGGGRYDALVDELGGKSCPAVGWALGMERLVGLIEAVDKAPESLQAQAPHCFLVVASDVDLISGQQLAEELRDRVAGLRLVANIVPASLKAQFKRADKSGASYALVLGADEHRDKSVTVKPLRDDGEQLTVTREQIFNHLSELISH